jgi:hypothetical protein
MFGEVLELYIYFYDGIHYFDIWYYKERTHA